MAYLTRVAPELPVADLRAAIDYYEQRLGFHLVMEMQRAYAIVERDGVAIHLFADSARAHSPVGIHLFAAQLDELHAEVRNRGARLSQELLSQPWGTRDFRVTDPAGNELKFTEPLAEE